MSKERKLGKNLVFSAIASGSNLFLFALSLVAARYLRASGYGRFSYALDFVTMFTYLTGCSMHLMGTITVARDRGKVNHFFGNLLTLQTLLTGGVVLLIIASIGVMHQPEETRLAVYLLIVVMVCRAYKSSLRMVFKAFERFDLESLSMALGQGALLVVGFVVLRSGWGLIAFAAAFAVVRVTDLLLTFALIRRTIAPLKPEFDFDVWPMLLRGGLLFGAISVLNELAFRLDTVLLGHWVTDAQIGWYKAAYRIPEGLVEIPVIIAWTLLPSLSVAHMRSKEEVIALYRRGVKFLMLAALPLTAVIGLRADQVVRLAFGAEYVNSIPVLQVLMLSVPCMFLTWISSSVLMSVDRPEVTFYRSGTAVVINVVVNLILIPRMGIMGAAISTVITELVAAALVTLYLFTHGYGFAWARTFAKAMSVTAALAAVLLLLPHMGLVAAFPLASLTYLLGLHLVRIWDDDERQILLGALGVFSSREVAGSGVSRA